MAIKFHNPDGTQRRSPVAAIAPRYPLAHAGCMFQVKQASLSMDPDVPQNKIELAWDNLFAVQANAGIGATGLVKVDGFIMRPGLVPLYRMERKRQFEGHAAANTMVVVGGLAEPNLLVGIQAVAARRTARWTS